MTQYYVGSKQVLAWEAEKDGRPGYSVQYPDGYLSWCPAETFEAAYLPMGHGAEPGRVNEAMVEGFVRRVETMTVGKTTIVHATLANGYELVESSACVDPANYDEELGKQLCLRRVKDRVWQLLGFLLQTARKGVKVV